MRRSAGIIFNPWLPSHATVTVVFGPSPWHADKNLVLIGGVIYWTSCSSHDIGGVDD